EGDRGEGGRRRRYAVSPLPAALGPGSGGLPQRGGCLRGCGREPCGGARTGRGACTLDATVRRPDRSETRARRRAFFGRPGVPVLTELFPRSNSARASVSARCRD